MDTSTKSAGRLRPVTVSALLRQILLVVTVLFLLGLAALQARKMREERHAGQRSFGVTYSAGTPPVLTFTTVALAGFRGIIADLLWLRSSRMQEQGRFLELAQLAEWITALEPANGDVWAYHAWNLAYNVSMLVSRPEDRWRWVRQGMELLQSEGVRLNPANAQLRKELAWMYLHKLGSDMDRDAAYFRTQWAREIDPYLAEGGEPPAPGTLNDAEITEVFGLKTFVMRRLEERFGRLDWRVPGAQALYWAMEALEQAEEKERLACCRVAYQALSQMVRLDGLLSGNPGDEGFVYQSLPNEGLLEGSVLFFEEVLQEHKFEGVKLAFIALLLEGIKIDAAHGREEMAVVRYRRIAELAGANATLPPLSEIMEGRAVINWDALLEQR